MSYRSDAKRVLTYYLKNAGKGWQWNSDNDAETSDIVDYIIKAAVEEMKAELRKEVPA